MTYLMNLGGLLPEFIIVIGAMLLLVLGAFSGVGNDRDQASGQAAGTLSIVILLLAAVGIFLTEGNVSYFDGAFVVDGFARFVEVMIIVASIFAILMSFDYLRDKGFLTFEFFVLILLAVAGMLAMVSANDLISLYLSLELQSLCLYVLAAVHRDSLRSSEAGLKYFVLGALSSGMLLYGASLIYGFTGSTNFDVIAEVAKSGAGDTNYGLIFGLVFVLVGLAFKVSAVPFHMWTPDVYEGAPTPVTAFFASAPKLAAMALLVRFVGDAFGGLDEKWQQIIVFVSIASMLLGAFAAIGQSNIKRLMAYSSIGHIGFALVGLASNSFEGVQALLIYLAIYVVMTLGAFACILAMRRQDHQIEKIDELAGLAQNNLPMAFVLGVLMFSLAGIPPLAGFFGKFFVFSAAIKAGLYPLAIIGVLASVVGAYYYLRVVKIMFFDEPKEKYSPIYGRLSLVMALSVLLIIGIGVIPGPLVEAASEAAKSLNF